MNDYQRGLLRAGLDRKDIVTAYEYMRERNFPDIAACRVIQALHDAIRAEAEKNADGQGLSEQHSKECASGEPEPAPSAPNEALIEEVANEFVLTQAQSCFAQDGQQNIKLAIREYLKRRKRA
jgi:hypothetical protein